MTRHYRWLVACCVSAGLLAGCETAPVKAWQRGDLARTEMAWQPDPMESAFRDHVYTSKEGASGGVGTGGGGCGCY
ncbi:DUF4266 domain-containing protein [Ketobacter sp.]|uniref:DUF4266 domain-containing protein n=1 Tax=Ketobacter sp. TaxID=2083498 RepID=UPI000F142EDD|nr:DUF4266 domain-containing protein [Ketobacter sp.]RLT94453.1 MAG: DUF4266 domain-containing protein [Ketobacter sp.]